MIKTYKNPVDQLNNFNLFFFQFDCFLEELCENSDLLPKRSLDFVSLPTSSTYSSSINKSSNTDDTSKNSSSTYSCASLGKQQTSNVSINKSTSSSSNNMYLLESTYPNQTNQTNSLTTSASMNSTNGPSSNNKNLINNNLVQSFSTLNSPLSSQSISSCESGNSPSLTNNGFNCESDCLLSANQQMNNYQPNSYITNYSGDKLNDKMKNSHTSTNDKSNLVNTSLNASTIHNNLINYDYIDNKFDNLFYSSWTGSSESINNLAYTEPLDGGNDIDYFILNSRSAKSDEQTIESHLNLNSSSMHGDDQLNLNRPDKDGLSKHVQSDKKTNLLTASESQQLAELLTLNDLNPTSLDCIHQPESNRPFEQLARPNWQTKSIFDWSTQELTEFIYSISTQYSYPIDDLRAYFLCYNPVQLANMDKEQMCCINSKYGSTVYQAINQLKIEFNNSFCKSIFEINKFSFGS